MLDRSKMRILVVDDFSTMRKIIINLLISIGFDRSKIDQADDGETAIPLFEMNKYDLIISDWNMPNVTGIDFLRFVRSHETKNSTLFILVTAEQKRSQILQAAEAGVDNYIVKPFTADTLNTRVHKVLSRLGDNKCTLI